MKKVILIGILVAACFAEVHYDKSPIENGGDVVKYDTNSSKGD